MYASILAVDDDPLICKGLKFNLEKSGYSVTTAMTSAAALDHIHRQKYQAVILDIGLPGEDGLSLCRHVKEIYDLPVILLTARRRELDEIIGLEVGADDYITKPFNVDVLLAHLKAVLRRSAARAVLPGGQLHTENISAGPFHIEVKSHRALKNGALLSLSPREFDLLFFFIEHPNQVFETDEIIDSVWGAEFTGEPQALYVHIRSLREKVEEEPSNPVYILTIRGVGYKFTP